jgi:hypothetical protein
METARQLQAALLSISKPVNAILTRLAEEGDGLLVAAADEKQENPRVSAIVYTGAESTSALANAILGKGKRTCSICGKPGHRKTTCPNADKAYKARKPKRHVSPERKAQLVKALEKARAARRKS